MWAAYPEKPFTGNGITPETSDELSALQHQILEGKRVTWPRVN